MGKGPPAAGSQVLESQVGLNLGKLKRRRARHKGAGKAKVQGIHKWCETFQEQHKAAS